jgi:hypothetical protein
MYIHPSQEKKGSQDPRKVGAAAAEERNKQCPNPHTWDGWVDGKQSDYGQA